MPAFYSFRARIRVQYASVVSDVGNVPSQNIDVKGDTWIAVTIPYLNLRPWYDINSTTNILGTLWIQQMTSIIGAPSPSTAVIYVNVFRSGGEDTQFACLWDPVSAEVSKKSKTHRYEETQMQDFKQQVSIKEKFSKTFESITPDTFQSEEVQMTMSEIVDSVSDLMKRPKKHSSATTLGDTNFSTCRIITASFMWYRGSTIWRHIHLGNSTAHNDGWYMDLSSTTENKIELGWAAAYQAPVGAYQQEAISVPWYCAQPYVATPASYAYIAGAHLQAFPQGPKLALATPDTLVASSGDDYTLLFQVPWANQFITPENKQRFLQGKGSDKQSIPESKKVLKV